MDHFIPWARYPENAIVNLVVAHERCNHQKRDFFAAVPHLERWVERSGTRDDELATIAQELRWPRDLGRLRAVATAMYTRLPEGVRLWVGGDEFVRLERGAVSRALSVGMS